MCHPCGRTAVICSHALFLCSERLATVMGNKDVWLHQDPPDLVAIWNQRPPGPLTKNCVSLLEEVSSSVDCPGVPCHM